MVTGSPVSLLLAEQPVQRPVEIAAVMGDLLGDEGEHRRGDIEARMVGAGGRGPALQDFQPQFLLERAHLDDQPAGKPRADAVVEAFQVARRTVGRDHNLPAAVDQRIERVAELGLRGFSLQELQIVDDQHIDAAQRFLEGERGLRFQRRHEPVHELFGGEVEHLAVRNAVAGPGDRLQQVRLAEPDARVDVERIEHHRLAAPRQRDLLGGGMGECVGAADHEGVEREPRIERRAAERLMGGLCRLMRDAQLALGAALDVAHRFDRLVRLHLDRRIAQHRRAMHQIDATDRGQFGLPAGEQLVGVVRLHPALEKTRGQRKPHDVVADCVVLHGAEPVLEVVLADDGAEPRLHAGPLFFVAQAHGLALTGLDGPGDRRGDKTSGLVRKGGC